VDLNLLRLFVALYEVGSLTVAAQRLFVSQPAASQALAKLRAALDDPLFERSGRVMVPTRLADALYPDFSAALRRIDDSVSDARAFDAAQTRRRFRIALSELGELAYLRPILRAVRTHAPHAGLDVVPLDVDALPRWLAQGTVDLAVTSSPVAGDFEPATVKPEAYVVLMAAAHPLAGRELTLDDYAAADHIVVASDSGMPRITAALARAGVEIAPAARVNHYSALAGLLLAGDLIATAPASFVAPWTRSLPVVVHPLPVDIPPVEVRLLMRATSEQRAGLTWLRRTVLDAMRTVPAENWAPAV